MFLFLFFCLRSTVRETLHDLCSLYSSAKAILKLSQSARGHFVTLIDFRMHESTCSPGDIYREFKKLRRLLQ